MNEFVNVVASDEHPGIATIVLSRPPANALTRQMYREIVAAAQDVGHRDDIAAVVVFGGHGIFSAGDDMPELRRFRPDEVDTVAQVCRDAVDALAAIPKPTVAAVTGYALGSGLTLALAADRRVSGDNVKFGATEILAGLIPGGGGTARLTRAIGVSNAKDLTFSGRFVGAQEALAIGLTDDMVAPDHVYDAALAWSLRFTDQPPKALAAAKASIDEAAADRLTAEHERRRYVDVFARSAGR